jgi:branched-chain amino acid transport system ATP-binding protein
VSESLFDASQMGDTPGAGGPEAGPDGEKPAAVSVPVDTEARQNSVLYADHITIQFGGLVAVDDVSFTIPPKSVVSLIGPNGAGKTTFFNVITGLYKVTSGIVFLEGKDITNVKPYDRAAMGLARTFQNIRLFNLMTAEENVMVAMHPHLNLSYGDQRRLEIARAMALKPKVLLLDEPTAGMNPQESAAFNEFVYRVRDEKGISVLLIEHDMAVIMKISERITVLDRGKMIAEGTPDDIRNNQTVIEAYLGKTGTREGKRNKP